MSAERAPASAEQLQVQVRVGFAASASPFLLDVGFCAPAGITILFGASGAGKTTVLNCIAGLLTPREGRIAIGGNVLFDSAARVNIAPSRREVGYLLQSLALFPHMSVRQNVQYGLASLETREREERCAEVLESFRIASLAARRPRELSGGEQQRVALARALVARPRVLLLDEPLTALDTVTKAQIVDDLRAWNARRQIPVLYVTHDREEVFALGENVIVLEAGRIVAQGSPHDLLHRPQLESVAQLAGFENILDCVVVGKHPEQGTMSCRIAGSVVELEVPLVRVKSETVRVGIRAGDILLASEAPRGLSARNVLPAVITSLQQRDITMVARLNCGVELEAHLTLGARQALALEPGAKVWIVLKTYSCHVLQ